MATENIVMLACAAALVTLHVLGGSLTGVRPRRRRSSAPPPPARAATPMATPSIAVEPERS
jgi:hypothetical protein